MAELTSMQNIGTEMARKLTAVGIDTPEKLTQLGSKHAYFKLRSISPNLSGPSVRPGGGHSSHRL